MNWLDIVLLAIVAISVAASFRKGLTHEVIGLASVVLGLLLGAWFHGTVAGYLQPYLSSRAAANFAGFLIVFCGVVLLGAVVSRIIGKFLRITGLSIFDRLLGAGFGLARGILIAVALIMAILAFSPGDRPPRAVVDSRMAPYVASAARVFVAMAPRDLKDGFHKAYAEAKETWDEAVGKGTHTAPKGDKGKK